MKTTSQSLSGQGRSGSELVVVVDGGIGGVGVVGVVVGGRSRRGMIATERFASGGCTRSIAVETIINGLRKPTNKHSE
jgi:hypothetical protein